MCSHRYRLDCPNCDYVWWHVGEREDVEFTGLDECMSCGHRAVIIEDDIVEDDDPEPEAVLKNEDDIECAALIDALEDIDVKICWNIETRHDPMTAPREQKEWPLVVPFWEDSVGFIDNLDRLGSSWMLRKFLALNFKFEGETEGVPDDYIESDD